MSQYGRKTFTLKEWFRRAHKLQTRKVGKVKHTRGKGVDKAKLDRIVNPDGKA